MAHPNNEDNTIPNHLDPRALEVARRFWQTTSEEQGNLVIEELDKTLDQIEKEKEAAQAKQEEKPKTALQEFKDALDKSAQSHADALGMVTDLLNALRSRLDSEKGISHD